MILIKELVKMICFLMIFSLMILNTKEEFTVNYFFNIDKNNCILIILSLYLMTLSMMKKFNYSNKSLLKKSLILNISVIFLCILTFSSSDKMMFFLCFETSVIPMIIMIFFLSKSKEKISSSLYMLIINMTGSIPFMMFILMEYKNSNSSYINIIYMNNLKTWELILTMSMLIMLMSKIPMFFLHIWLPKAHVEASTLGSMILAGLMLKLGISGLIKNLYSIEEKIKMIKWMIMSISWVSVIYCMIMSIRSVDIKKMTAISSISHMGMTTNSIFTMKSYGLIGGMMMTISHGMVSSIMFLLIGLMYENSESRSIYSNKNLESMNKQLSFWWSLNLFLNIGVPPTSSFFSEIFMLISFSIMEKSSMFFMLTSMFMISSTSMLFMIKNIFMKSETLSSYNKYLNLNIMNFLITMVFMNILTVKIM